MNDYSRRKDRVCNRCGHTYITRYYSYEKIPKYSYSKFANLCMNCYETGMDGSLKWWERRDITRKKIRQYIKLEPMSCYWCNHVVLYRDGFLYGPFILCKNCDEKAQEKLMNWCDEHDLYMLEPLSFEDLDDW
jgi:hypothetical protein